MDLKADKRLHRCSIIYTDGHGHCTFVEVNKSGKAVKAYSNSCDGIVYYPAIAQLKEWDQLHLADRADRAQQSRWDEISHFESENGRIEKEV